MPRRSVLLIALLACCLADSVCAQQAGVPEVPPAPAAPGVPATPEAAAAPATPVAQAAPAAPAAGPLDLTRADVRAFIDGAVRKHGLDRAAVTRLLGAARTQPKIIEAISRPAERVRPWWEYRKGFLTEERIAQGAQFWQANRAALERIAAERGVAPQYIVAIIGVETFYGRITGRYRVLDALATLAFDYPPRASFFRSELEQFLLLVREERIDPLAVTGSYAGAMGAAQFMPSSYRRYALDGDADGRRDLWQDWPDVFASIANYFRQHGWESGGPVLAEAVLDPDPPFVIDPRNIELDTTLDALNATGVRVEPERPGDTRALLISAEQPDGPAYRVGFRNFYVITRYNRSARYAMAVNDLATEVAARIAALPAPAAPITPITPAAPITPATPATPTAPAAPTTPPAMTTPAEPALAPPAEPAPAAPPPGGVRP